MRCISLTNRWVRPINRIFCSFTVFEGAREFHFIMADGSLEFAMSDLEFAREMVLSVFKRTTNRVIYFDGWYGLGAAPVLRSIAKLYASPSKEHPPELRFDTVLYIDCSIWGGDRAMQRKIATELGLDRKTMALLDEQDEDDDFNGKGNSSRGLIRSVSTAIDRTVGYKKILMVFLNGSNDEVDVSRFCINPEYREHRVLWTFKKKMEPTICLDDIRDFKKLRYTNFTISGGGSLTYSQFYALVNEEAATAFPHLCDAVLTLITEYFIYGLFLQYSFRNTSGFNWVPRNAFNCWMYDEIVQGAKAREISNLLHQASGMSLISSSLSRKLGYHFEMFQKDPDIPFFVIKDDGVFENRTYPWITITSKNLKVQIKDMQSILERASSLFVAFEKPNNSPGLSNGLFKNCNNIRVLILSCCGFSFVSPPFFHCNTIRFLELDLCTDDRTTEGEEECPRWTFLHSLQVLVLCYTEWHEILSDTKMDLMANLKELNMQGFKCWKYIAQFQRKLAHLQKLRITKPMHHADQGSTNIKDSFDDKRRLQVLDLSGNKVMERLPSNLSNANNLQVLVLDGCDELENVVMSDPSSLRLFSFDGYGPASYWPASTIELPSISCRPISSLNPDTKNDKTTKISLQGCIQLEKLFLRGLSNLVELDLSGSQIKILDFVTMVVGVPKLKRLFLMGCEHLRAIRWDPMEWNKGDWLLSHKLELLCIDTRSTRRTKVGRTLPALAQHKPFKLQVHAVLTDARIARSLCPPVQTQGDDAADDIYFDIHIVSSTVYGGGLVAELEDTTSIIEDSNQYHRHVLLTAGMMYDDVFADVVDGNFIPMKAFPPPPTLQLDRHIEIGDRSHVGGNELNGNYSPYSPGSLGKLMRRYVESLHVHDVSTTASLTPHWRCLRWCRMERCSKMETIFSPMGLSSFRCLEKFWASELVTSRSIWNKSSVPGRNWGYSNNSFDSLRQLHLRRCPRLRFVLPLWQSTFPNMETLHIIHCGELTDVFVRDEFCTEDQIVKRGAVRFPKLTTIHLHDLPNLRRICGGDKMMLAPKLEAVRIRGCWGLRCLPALEGREPGLKRPTVEMEKDVWDAMEWDGLAAGHHPDLFEPLVHSRHYKRRHLKGTVLR